MLYANVLFKHPWFDTVIQEPYHTSETTGFSYKVEIHCFYVPFSVFIIRVTRKETKIYTLLKAMYRRRFLFSFTTSPPPFHDTHSLVNEKITLLSNIMNLKPLVRNENCYTNHLSLVDYLIITIIQNINLEEFIIISRHVIQIL